MNAAAASASVNVPNAAVGTPASRISRLANAFDPSISAAARDGPKNGRFAARIASPRPAHSGTSGPHTTRSTRSATAAATSSAMASAAIGMHLTLGSAAMPGLPGATTISRHSGLCPIFQASACSRPPEPTRRIRMRYVVRA